MDLSIEQVMLAAKACNDNIFNSADNSKDFWRILSTQIILAAKEFISANPEKKIETDMGTMLDKVKYEIFRSASDWKKEGMKQAKASWHDYHYHPST